MKIGNLELTTEPAGTSRGWRVSLLGCADGWGHFHVARVV